MSCDNICPEGYEYDEDSGLYIKVDQSVIGLPTIQPNLRCEME